MLYFETAVKVRFVHVDFSVTILYSHLRPEDLGVGKISRYPVGK